jgi:hypothetical protein
MRTNERNDNQSPDNINAAVNSLVETVLLDRTVVLAREGRLAQAEALLRPAVESGCAGAAAADLLAKVCAQQGKTKEAGGFWKLALAGDPDNPLYLSALKKCGSIKKRRPSFYSVGSFRKASIGMAAIAAVALLTIMAFNYQGQDGGVNIIDIGPQQAAPPVIKSGQYAVYPDLREQAENVLQEKNITIPLLIEQDGDIIQVKGKLPDLRTRYQVEMLVKSVPGVRVVDMSGLELNEVYTVKSGDSLSAISCDLYGTAGSWEELAAVNGIQPPYLIYTGQQITMPEAANLIR